MCSNCQVHKAYRFALDATPEQVRRFERHAGAARFAFNWALAAVKANLDQRIAESTYGISDVDLAPALSWSLPSLRRSWNRAKHTVAPWWSECSKEAFNTGLDGVSRGLRNWADSKSRNRRGHMGFPRFRSRRGAKSSVRFRRRHDSIHKLTTRLARAYGTIVVEDLNVAGMLRNHRLSRAVADAGFGEIRRQLEYKTVWNGGLLVAADRWYPSSKTCSGCGVVKPKLPLRVRTFTCGACGLTLDRDHNAAINLKRQVAQSGWETLNGRGADRKTAVARQVAVKRQPGTVTDQTGTVLSQGGTIHPKRSTLSA